MKSCAYLLLLFFAGWWMPAATAQVACNTPGQNPSSAFPVCGTSTFIQSSVNLCGGRLVPNPKCKSNPLTDVNPYWYKFTCFKSGTLGFMITPNSNTSDYDWQVFDVTGRNVNDVFTDEKLVVSCNWSQYFGETGTTTTAASLMECEGTVPKYSKMPDLIQGHDYLLLVSHFSNTQAGYKLQFGGGSAIITDTTQPEMKELQVGCAGTQFYLKLNKKMKCSSIAADGSDWEFVSSSVSIASVTGAGCNAGFETDSLIITTAAVPAGTFTLRSKKGSDGNTLLDLCDAPLPEGQTLVVNVLPAAPTLFDSVAKVGCKPSSIDIVMKGSVRCSSIASDGSDFVIAGPSPVMIRSAEAPSCTNGNSEVVRLQLAAPIQKGGVYTIQLRRGTDGNTLTNECAKETPEYITASFSAYDTVSANFALQVSSSCVADTVRTFNAGGNGTRQWQWLENGLPTGNQPFLQRIYTTDGSRVIVLAVSNGVCTDSASATFSTTNTRVKAAFEFPQFACPTDTVQFIDKSTGPVAGWQWDFGNGNTSNSKTPPWQQYASATALSLIPVKLVVSHANGCQDSITHRIQVPNNCFIAVATGFTPNGDGLNDYLYPLNAWKAKDLHFRVYNRYGQLIWETRDWTRKWDGRQHGNPLTTGTYVWMLEYTDDKGQRIAQKGTTVLIR